MPINGHANGAYDIEKHQTNDGKGKADFELEERRLSRSQDGKDGELQKKDPFDAVDDFKPIGVPWGELDTAGKVKRVLLTSAKLIILIGMLYLFICSLSFLTSAFRLLGGKKTGEAFSSNSVVSNPFAGLMMGVLGTVLLQSSSTTTSIVVAMVAAGILEVEPAIPIVMGANIGTSVTNTIVSIGQIADKEQYRRAFAGATVHDMFNLLSVLIFLPVELASRYLFRLTEKIIDSLKLKSDKALKQDLLKKITKPFTEVIIQLDTDLIEKIAKKNATKEEETRSLIKVVCGKPKKVPFTFNITKVFNETVSINTTKVFNETVSVNATNDFNETVLLNITNVVNKTVPQNVSRPVTYILPETKTNTTGGKPCKFLFYDTGISDTGVGIILLILSLILLCICLVIIVKTLHSLLRGQIALVIRKTFNADFPKPFGFLTGYIAILVGAGLTILVQSSSIFTSALTPLVGLGIVALDRVYPLTLGSNIGTTATGILAAFASDGDELALALQIALCHLFFNISGILIWYPIPLLRRVPIKMAKALGNTTAEYKWFAIVYLFVVFFILPGSIFGLSLAGWKVFAGIMVPIAVFVLVIVIINVMQRKKQNWLPNRLRSWEWLPKTCRSLEPYDHVASKVIKKLNIKRLQSVK